MNTGTENWIKAVFAQGYESGKETGLEKIRQYIKECHEKGYELQTIMEHLENEFIMEKILK